MNRIMERFGVMILILVPSHWIIGYFGIGPEWAWSIGAMTGFTASIIVDFFIHRPEENN